MNLPRLCTCGILWLFLILFSQNPARADVSLTATGISSLVANNASQAEKTAFDDALYKVYLELALRVVPGSSSFELTQKLKGFVSSRGIQDIIQYKIVSRSQQDTLLMITIDITLNDTPLRNWLQGQSLMTPYAMRPRILLVITCRGPGPSDRYEWWTTSTPKGYSPFESQMATMFRNVGENIADPPQQITPPPSGSDKAVILGGSQGIDLVLSGLITHKSIDAATLDSRLDISLVDPKTRQHLISESVSLKGTVDQRMMNELLITAVMVQIRAEIAKKVIAVNPSVNEKALCIEGILDNDTYQIIINALRSMDTVSKITVSRIQGHTICHVVQLKGNLQDTMESLRQRNVVSADIAIEGDTAYIRILNP
ncbi:MAG TPA: hypothetical protein PKY89_11865 [Deltaproteobacteria bacterium]|nr:hypothetical protein [Deltaproteobacteria bacterium]